MMRSSDTAIAAVMARTTMVGLRWCGIATDTGNIQILLCARRRFGTSSRHETSLSGVMEAVRAGAGASGVDAAAGLGTELSCAAQRCEAAKAAISRRIKRNLMAFPIFEFNNFSKISHLAFPDWRPDTPTYYW